jgi:tRNA (guanosine-2'-O-)-methyltransferase
MADLKCRPFLFPIAMKNKSNLVEHLSSFMTEERAILFENILNKRTRHVTVVLEDLYQPHNASAVIRSCDCFGIQDIHAIENINSFNITKGISVGSRKWLTVNRYREKEQNTLKCLNSLKNQGYKIIATTPHKDDCLINELDLTHKTALVFGTEIKGMSQAVIDNADGFVKIPMYGFTESFNISVAAALCLYEVRNQLIEQKIDWNLSHEEMIDLKLEWMTKSVRASAKIIEKWNSNNVK